MTDFYPKPSDIGGVLIRKVIALFKERETALPLLGDVLISVSGGIDSMVLAHLVCTYGRKIANLSQITLVHFDHEWRAESGREEKSLVENLAKLLGVKFIHQKLASPESEQASKNIEEDGRLKRQAAYANLLKSRSPDSVILTAHHENDAVESIFWRFCRGEFDAFREGILFQDSACLRPFLKVTKKEIGEYASIEKIEFLEDPTNQDSKFFRAWMRTEVFPLLEAHFPQIQKTLSHYLTKPTSDTIDDPHGLTLAVQTVIGTSLNRAQRTALHEMANQLTPGKALSLPGGVQIRRTVDGFFIENVTEKYNSES
jgi:tRNA(Ile)-lysidine synthetase-like protein